jgi:hypothetical protein
VYLRIYACMHVYAIFFPPDALSLCMYAAM